MDALAAGSAQQARSLAEAVLAEHRRDDLAMALLAQACNHLGDRQQALAHINAAIARNGKRGDYHGLLADMLVTSGRFHDALGAYDRALKYSPSHPGVLAGKANAYLRLNESAKARTVLEPAMRGGDEDPVLAIVMARALVAEGNPHGASEVLLPHLPATGEPVETQRGLYFAMAAAMEAAGEYVGTLEALGEANALSASGFDTDAHAARHDGIINAFSADAWKRMPTSTQPSTQPVFIVGMLRSGSTLVEQIIDAHGDGEGLGELETLPQLVQETLLLAATGGGIADGWERLSADDLDEIAGRYLRQTASDAQRFVDKQLGNYQVAGAIAKLFPAGRIIHCRRHPMAMGFSCYAQKLPPGTNAWASSLEDIGLFYCAYERLMDHWTTLLGDRMLEVRYEDLVADQEATTRRILEFCDLPFDERCLRFWESGRTVLTLSQDQVRRPLYDTSVARHEQFGGLLEPLRAALGEAIERYEAGA